MSVNFEAQHNQLIAGRYRLLQPLGSGGFGDTFLGSDEQLPSGRRVVVKRLRPIKDDEPAREAINTAFRREAQLLEQVGWDHSQIPELFAYFEEDSAFWLVQEFIPGPTLANLGRIDADTARHILREILPVLIHLHSRNLIHRDIKPDNIILRESDQKPVLIDFGAVRETMSTVMMSSGAACNSFVIGTQGFMPPEQAAGRAIFSSDLYALSLSLISLLTGKSPQALSTDPISGAVLWRSDAPATDNNLADLLDRAIQPIPAQRFASAQAMLDSLQAAECPPLAIAASTAAPLQTLVEVPIPPHTEAESTASAASENPSSSMIYQSGFRLIMGLALGIGAIYLMRQQPQQIHTSQNRPVEQQTGEQKSQLGTGKSTAEAQKPTEPQAINKFDLNQNQAVDLVNRWLVSKNQVFAPPYDPSAAASVVTGTLWQDLIKEDGPIVWLRKNNSYYTYAASRVEGVLSYDSSGSRPSLRVKIHEERTLHTPTGIDPSQSGITDAAFTYYFEKENGVWMVADYTKG